MISIELTKRFKKIVREAGRQTEVSVTLQLMMAGFGNPHSHSGLGIRKLGTHLYECRTSRSWRLVFKAQKRYLEFDFASDHDDVQNYICGRR
jgi:hypothetical protein